MSLGLEHHTDNEEDEGGGGGGDIKMACVWMGVDREG